VIVLISLIPIFVEALRSRREKRRSAERDMARSTGRH
jgi:hypothetical protein